MKRCPTCNRTFEEEWLGFCTEDGAALVASGPLPEEPPPTVRIPAAPVTNPEGRPPFDLPGSYNPPRPVAPQWQPPPPPPIRMASGQQQGLAIAALCCGIFSVTIGWCCYLGVISGPVAIALGGYQLSQIKKDPTKFGGKPMALTGLILGAAYFVLMGIFVLIYGLALFAGGMAG